MIHDPHHVQTATVEKEMGYTHHEFLRLLPRAFHSHAYHVNGDHIEVIGPHHRRLEIQLGPEKVRQIALMRIPFMHVVFSFSGYTDDELRSFLAGFDRVYQRGGG